MTSLREHRNPMAITIQIWPLASGMSLLLVLLLILPDTRTALLLLLGAALGATLQLTAFGFTSGYRRFLVRRETTSLHAQLLMLAVATLLFSPLLALSNDFAGATAPASLSVAIGALLFGLGMQLGDGCGSGTLYKAGAGATHMFVTLATFCAGSFFASLHMGWWQTLPVLPVYSLAEIAGYLPGAMFQLGLIGLLLLLLRRWRHYQAPQQWRETSAHLLLVGAVLLALLNFATLLTAGHPWTITWGFTLWGAKAAYWIGWDPAGSLFWSAPLQREALNAGILDDVTSLMDIGVLVGALMAAAISGRFRLTLKLPLRLLFAAAIGGLLMGYGARIAYGCNIGAFFSGIASMSLHGWLWIACALAGSALGVRARPWFNLTN